MHSSRHNISHARLTGWIIGLVLLGGLTDGGRPCRAAESSSEFDVVFLRGQVVWYGKVLKERLGINTVPEAEQRVLALETDEGRLIPLIEDLRTRSFRKDERLREMHVELQVRRYHATPGLQILKVFQLSDGKVFEVDYWCDVCAIEMYEMGPCACCQDDNRLRKREVDR